LHCVFKRFSYALGIFLFPEKETKSVGLLRGRSPYAQTSAKPTQGGWGLAPKEIILSLIMIKSVSLHIKSEETQPTYARRVS
jgi:hypothetical protein